MFCYFKILSFNVRFIIIHLSVFQIAYIVFLMTFTYVVLVKTEEIPSWQELFTIAYIMTLACEKIREIVSSEPVAVR
jgi:Stage III sporulation protein AC/AD protein family.